MSADPAAPDFADARRIVRDFLLDHWTAEDGQLYVADYGYESPTQWRVPAGSYEALVLRDPDYLIEPGAACLVDKQTGQVESVPLTPDNLARLESMTTYGNPPPEGVDPNPAQG